MAGMEVWWGRSQLTGEDIVLLLTDGSKNTKTGDMLQTWILRADRLPSKAATKGIADEAICGDCIFRGSATETRRCYVNTTFAPNGVWRAWTRGTYGVGVQPEWVGQPLRVGAYGDPAAVPLPVWQKLFTKLVPSRWTGYTHQWRDPRFQPLQDFCMASVNSTAEQHIAEGMGWRTFRVGGPQAEGREILCPASAEAGHRTTCAKCTLCDGQHNDGRASIYIPPHGSRAKNWNLDGNANLMIG